MLLLGLLQLKYVLEKVQNGGENSGFCHYGCNGGVYYWLELEQLYNKCLIIDFLECTI